MRKKDLELASKLELSLPKKPVEILDIDEIEAMSLAEVNEAKRLLSLKRKQIQLQLDGKKLEQALRIVDITDLILEKLYNGLIDNSLSAIDSKFLTESYDKLTKNLGILGRFDSLDESGNAARINIEIRYGN